MENLLPLTSCNYLFPSPLPLSFSTSHCSVNTDLTSLHISPGSALSLPPPPSPPRESPALPSSLSTPVCHTGTSPYSSSGCGLQEAYIGFLIRASSQLSLGGSNTSLHVKGESRTVRSWVVPVLEPCLPDMGKFEDQSPQEGLRDAGLPPWLTQQGWGLTFALLGGEGGEKGL